MEFDSEAMIIWLIMHLIYPFQGLILSLILRFSDPIIL